MDWSTLLNSTIPPGKVTMMIMAIVFAVMILIASAISIFLKAESRKTIGSFVPLLLTGGITGLINLFAWYEALPGLGTPLFLICLLAVLLIWVIFLLVIMIRNFPKARIEHERRQRYEKYLPKVRKS